MGPSQLPLNHCGWWPIPAALSPARTFGLILWKTCPPKWRLAVPPPSPPCRAAREAGGAFLVLLTGIGGSREGLHFVSSTSQGPLMASTAPGDALQPPSLISRLLFQIPAPHPRSISSCSTELPSPFCGFLAGKCRHSQPGNMPKHLVSSYHL